MNTAIVLFGVVCALFQNIESKSIVCPTNVFGQVDGSVSIVCRYSTKTKANMHARKYFCPEASGQQKCKYTIAATTGYLHINYAERVSITDNTEEGQVVITFGNLQKTDEGTYICGLGTDGKWMKATFKLTVMNEDTVIPNDVTLLYVQRRGSVTFKCDFDDQSVEQTKSLCKLGNKGCKNIIDSSGKIDPKYTGRIRLLPNKSSPASFIAQMIQLELEDYGVYSCITGTDGAEGAILHFDLRINEETDIPQGSRSLATREGGSIAAQCNYDPKVNYTLKIWCKWEDSVCTPLVNTDGFIKDGYEGKVLIHDDPKNGRMQVLMTKISKADEGWYWYVMTDGNHDLTSSIQVKISEELTQGLTGGTTIHVKKGETAKFTCFSPCKFKTHEKYWCKWRNTDCKIVTSKVDLNENDLSVSCGIQELNLIIDSVSEKDAGWYWCGVKTSGTFKDIAVIQLIVENEATGDSPNPSNNRMAPINEANEDTPSSENKQHTSTLVAAILSVCAAILIASAVFVIIRLRNKKNSDLVSVGSYRTNISMTDLDNDTGKENPAVIDTQETDISNSNDGAKMKKKGSREDLDYSSFLIHHNGSPHEENTA